MTSYRPPFGRRRGGDTMVVLSRPSPQAFSRSRTADQSGRSMGTFRPMTLTRPVSSLAQSTKKENFEDFVARMMKTDEFGPGLKVHSVQTTLANSNSVDPPQSEERKKQLQFRLQQRLDKQSESLDARQSQDQRQNDDENNVRQKNDAGADGIKSRFGAGWDDMRSFQNRKRIWKSSLKSTLKFLQGSNYNQRPNPSELDDESSTLEILAKRPAENDTKSNLTDDLNKILQRGSALLLASSALKPRSKVKKEPLKKPIHHSPPSTSVVAKPKTKSGPQAHPMFERNTTWKDWLQGSGFPFDEFENEISGAIKTAAREMKRSIGGEIPENSARKKPFDGIKISSLVGTNAGKVQGFRQSRVLGEQDNMNPLQLKMVQGLQDAELSSFLENHGRRNPDFGMQIIPGRALDPGSGFSTTPRGMSKVKGQHISRDHTSTLEPKFRALPRSVKSRFGEDFGVVRKDESDNKDLSEYGSNRSPRYRNKSPDVPKIDRLKKLSFMDVTKSQFIREMRQHQSQFQQMKSKDEMRKSFPKTYIFPHHIRRKK